MKTAIAILKKHRQSPRKVRLVAGLIRGKKIADAKTALKFAVKKASSPIEKLLDSAIANAVEQKLAIEKLYVENITVDKGATLYRSMPRARGRSAPIRKRTSHIKITLLEKEVVPKKSKRTKNKEENK